jgi:long-chain acyl-CoA synthetase
VAFLCERRDDLTPFDLSRFRHIICGAGPLTVELARRFDAAFGVRVVHGYGLSETTCYSSFLPVDLNREEYAHWMFDCGFPSIGCPIACNAMAIQDAQGIPLPPDTRGEIVARGHNVMKYYFQRPDANRDTFAHGWFRSGDEGFYRVGQDGRDYYFITGRLKELIIRGGVNYSPFDIDEALNAIPGVKAAMAVGFENDFYGEEVGAYVQLEEGATLTESDILRACRERMPFSKSPKVVVFGDTFPVTSTGKYQRNRLKPLFSAWKDTQFREQPRSPGA